MPYTVSIEVEQTGSLRAPWSGYLVFPKWAETGVGIVGHVETEVFEQGRTEALVRESIESLTLDRVKALLDTAIRDHMVRDPEAGMEHGA